MRWIYAVLLSAQLVTCVDEPIFAYNPNGPWVPWFRSIEVPYNPAYKCCGEADGFLVDSYEPSETTPGGFTAHLGPDTFEVSPDKVNWGRAADNPTGRAVIFLSPKDDELSTMTGSQFVYCFVPSFGV